MHHPVIRIALVALMLAAGHAGASAAHQPAKERSCGLVRDSDGARIGVVIQRGKPTCTNAKKVIRTYFRPKAPCDGKACVREHFGWTCASAITVDAFPRLATCDQGRARVATYSTAD